MIGNMLIIVFLLFSGVLGASAPRIEVRCVSVVGISFTRVPAGEPFQCEVRVEGVTKEHGWPTCKGLRADYIKGRQQRREVSYVNGAYRTQLCFIYELMVPRPGKVRIGPVSYPTDSGALVESPVTTITITDEPPRTAPARTPAAPQDTRSFAQWECEKTDCWAGEYVPCVLAWYAADGAGVEEAAIAEGNELRVVLEKNAHTKQVTHNGKSYKCHFWSGGLCPEKSGIYLFPMAQISFNAQASLLDAPWNMMMQFLNGGHVQRTPNRSMRVKSLPSTKEKSMLVGTITSLEWRVAQQEVAVGQAGVVTLVMRGALPPYACTIEAPAYDMQRMKLYPSAVRISGTYPEVTYEQDWICQGVREGEGVVRAHTYWFFNPVTTKYESIEVAGFTVGITPAVISTVPPTQLQEPAVASGLGEDERVHQVHDEHQTLREQVCDWVSGLREPYIPFVWYSILLVLPVFYVLFLPLGRRAYVWSARRWRIYRWEQRLQRLCWDEDSLLDPQKIWIALRAFCAYLISDNTVGEDDWDLHVAQWLRERNATPAVLAEWDLFVVQLKKSVFAPDGYIDASLKQAIYRWVGLLGTYARKNRE